VSALSAPHADKELLTDKEAKRIESDADFDDTADTDTSSEVGDVGR
jgi:hypothetical protein